MKLHGPWILVLLGLAGSPPAPPASGGSVATGVVVQEVRRGTTAEKAGLLAGDVLYAWTRAAAPPANPRPAAGSLRSPFHLLDVFVEELPRGPVTLAGRRGEREMSWLLPGGWPCDLQEVRVAPLLSGDLAERQALGEARLASGEVAAAASALEGAAALARGRGDPETASWLLSRLASSHAAAGRWGEADAVFARALAPLERHPQGSTTAAHLLRQWGDTFRIRAAWQRADERYRRALAVDRKLASQSLAAAQSLTGRGHVASVSEGSLSAEALYREALALRERLAPGSSEVAASWFDLFHDARLRQETAQARERLETAVMLQEKATPGSLYAARKLTTLGINELAAGELAAARAHLGRAFELACALAPEDPDVPYMLQGLGMVASRQGDPRTGVDFLRRAAALAEKVYPGSYQQADILHDLGLVERQAGRPVESARHLCRALDFPERRYLELAGNDEETSRLGVRFGHYYRDCTAALAEVGQERSAFEILERGRARALLNLLSGRPSPAAAGPAAVESRLLEDEYDRVQEALAGLDPGGQAQQVEQLTGRMLEIYRRQEEILAESAASAPRVAEPLTLDGVRRILDPGTVLAAYATGETETWLFVVRPAGARGRGLAAFRLAVGRAALAEKIGSLRNLLQDEDASLPARRARAAELYDLLLRPAEPLLAAGDRLLISPDGPLHTLPFGALWRRGRFLVEWRPLHFVLSATTYGEIRKARRPPGDPRQASLVAFGDPDYPQSGTSAGGQGDGLPTAEVWRRGLTPLPGTRREVLGIAALFPQARVYLGKEATEERFKSLPTGIRYLHFAVHGLLDERFPLNSALALSLPPEPGPGRDNGLLQVWEIARGRPLDADLVTISACESALGRDRGGEGLIGLTRAFQYAGARSVLAALWSIPDDATAALMADVYTRLRAGTPKAQALRAAQIAHLRTAGSGGAAWAAFQLYGDWK